MLSVTLTASICTLSKFCWGGGVLACCASPLVTARAVPTAIAPVIASARISGLPAGRQRCPRRPDVRRHRRRRHHRRGRREPALAEAGGAAAAPAPSGTRGTSLQVPHRSPRPESRGPLPAPP